MEEKIKHNPMNSLQIVIILIVLLLIVFSMMSMVLTNHFEYAIIGIVVALIIYVISKSIKKI